MEWLQLLFVHMSVCSPAQDWYEKRSIIHLCLESVHRDRRWLGSKTLSSHFSSHHLFSPCLLCHTLSLNVPFDLSIASLSHFYRFMALPRESSTPWSVWKVHRPQRCRRLFQLKIMMFAILLSLSTLWTPQSSHFLSFGLFDIVFQSCQASRFECDSHAIRPILTPHATLDISHAYISPFNTLHLFFYDNKFWSSQIAVVRVTLIDWPR